MKWTKPVIVVSSVGLLALALLRPLWPHFRVLIRTWAPSGVEPVAFEPDVWRQTDVNWGDGRIGMAEWLIESDTLVHLTRDGCIAMIGHPESSFEHHGARLDVYPVGWGTGLQSSDRVQMQVQYDEKGRVGSVDLR